MTYAELTTFTNKLLGGRSIDATSLKTFLNLAKDQIESERDWRFLITQDASKTVTASDTYLTAKALPSNFKRALKNEPVVLVSSDGNTIIPYTEIPFQERHQRKDEAQRFYIDHRNGNFYLTGSVDKTYTINLYYLAKSADLTDTPDTTWAFPSEFHPLLGYEVAIMEKAGDWDEQNQVNINLYSVKAEGIKNRMILWDAQMAVNALGL